MKILATFKQLVDDAPTNISAFKDDHMRISAYLGIDTTNGYSSNWVRDTLHENIDRLLSPSSGDQLISIETLGDLNEALVYDAVLNNKDNSIHLSLFRIVARSKTPLRSLDFKPNWQKALSYAKDYELLFPGTYTVTMSTLRRNFPKYYDIADAAKQLKQMGCAVTMEDLSLETGDLEKITSSIEDRIEELGGVNVLASLFRQLVAEGRYFSVFNRYLVINRITMLAEQTGPMLPFGYLLNLSVKHPTEGRIKNLGRAEAVLDDIRLKATLLATVTGMRHYNIFEAVFQSPALLPKFVAHLALFDATYSFPSYDSCTILEYMEHLFTWVDAERFQARFGCTVSEVVEVSRTILSKAPDNGPSMVYASTIKKLLRFMPADRLATILGHLSHEKDEVNKGYAFVDDYLQLDFGFKPLIRLSPTKFLLCDKSWCSSGFYEALATMVRQLDMYQDECNNKVGDALEPYLYFKLDQSGINYSKGHYADSTKLDGQADGVIECPGNILLLEVKKKVMTRKAKTGADIDVIIDLAKSLFDAQIQAGRTELLLKRQGYVELIDKNNIIHIDHKGRTIERIALTQWEYGSFQDRMIINGLLDNFTKVDLYPINPADTNMTAKLRAAKKVSNAWQLLQAELKKTDPDYDHNPFLNSWFLNIPQIVTVLRYCKTNEEFWAALGSSKHVSLGTKNFYLEFYATYIQSHFPGK